jgi:hypothetical protein
MVRQFRDPDKRRGTHWLCAAGKVALRQRAARSLDCLREFL